MSNYQKTKQVFEWRKFPLAKDKPKKSKVIVTLPNTVDPRGINASGKIFGKPTVSDKPVK